MEFWKAVFFGVVQGITEWLPISSTGHLLLLQQFCPLDVSSAFFNLFLVVIQLFSVAAVALLYFRRLVVFPHMEASEKKRRFRLWKNILIATIPAALFGFLLDDLCDTYLYRSWVICVALIGYGVVFLFLSKISKKGSFSSAEELTSPASLAIGGFQILSLIPGTSRSGSTVIGGKLVGCSSTAATEFSFFLALPVMIGASLLRIIKYFSDGNSLSAGELSLILTGGLTAFLVSVVSVRFLLRVVEKHGFSPFGIYRILFGIFMLFYLNK